ncbi:DUF3168 domain-containing protein [Paracidovorax avenae]|uniref:DUF3168 domain-containing protein n=1 Tax=Paracidovorax avenae TaxID=80867 RepID=UPI000D21A2B9|nr:DUF3168 domain-containing protein [Paracidovorax avenae]AVS67855.1 DUF3168 domain-containing protein [Paracidovorax avenae]
MSLEADLFAALGPLVGGAAYPDVGPAGAPLPRIVYQQVGGRAINYTDDVLPDKRNARMQIACWASTRLQAVALALQVEAALLAAPGLQVEALGAHTSTYEEDTKLYGCRQDFSIWAAR